MEKAFRQRAAVGLLFLLLVISSCQHADSPHVQKGSIDLSHYSFENNPSLALDGEWEFYRDTLLQPKTFHALNTQPVYLHVPGIWNKPGKGGHGTGTYRLRVKLDSTSGYLAIKTPTASSAYHLWINDSLISSNGIVSSNLAEVRPQYISKVCVFAKPKGQMDIVVQVANNFHANGGLWETVRIGSQDAIISRYNNAFIFQMFLVGAFIILSIYHLWIYLLKRSERPALWFAFLCLSFTLRILVTGERFLYHVFPGFPMNIGLRIEYLSTFVLIVISLNGFLRFLFKKDYPAKAFTAIAIWCVIETALILTLPTKIYTATFANIARYFLIVNAIFFLFVLTKAAIHKRRASGLSLFATLVLLFIIANDILNYLFVIRTPSLISFGVLQFLIIQAYILAHRIRYSFTVVEKLSRELNETNLRLEEKVVERTEALAMEKRKSDELLLNILPAETAEELKRNGKAKARNYDMVSVIFTDFKDFTLVSEKANPELLVSEIDYCFSGFDQIIQKYNIEKIKTIGDAYMCVAGLPEPGATHANDAIRAALEMRDFMEQRLKERKPKGEICFEIRIGVNSGPVIAGVVGIKKFVYDIWGDTVNMAARMQQNSEPGKVNISDKTTSLVKDKFTFEHRGKLLAHHKGEIDMFFVEELNSVFETV